jgi:ABC-2 type transport system permease protein
MRTFVRLVKLAMLQQMTYRAAIIAGLSTNLFWGLLRSAVLIGLYGNQTSVGGMSLNDAISYVAISQATIAFLFVFGTYDLMNTVYTGSIGADLLKPIGLFSYWMAKDLGRSLVNLLTRGVLLLAFFALFYPVRLPQGPEGWGWALLVMALAWLVTFAWRFLVNLASFWTPDARGLARGAYTISQFLSGFLMPLRLYPAWFSALCNLTPFPAMFNSPVEVFLGITQGAALRNAIGVQVIWFVVMALLCLVFLRLGIRRLVIQGG